jgi:hypothetical protein
MARCYFFFAAFFAAFFAGAFLAAFLVAIFAYSPFSMGCIEAATTIAVEECIDSCFASVKRKTNERWKKQQQFFQIDSKTAMQR